MAAGLRQGLREGWARSNATREGRAGAPLYEAPTRLATSGAVIHAAAVTWVALLRLVPYQPSMPTDTGPSMVTRRTMRGASP
jgi:hypothetical protein